MLLRVRRGGGRLHAPSRRIHDGSNGGSGPGSRSSPFRMQNLQRLAGRRSPGREIPHAPQTRSTRPPKHGKRSGRGAPGDQMEGKGGVCGRPDAIVRGSGSLRACGARVTHAICKRYRSHIPTQIYSYAAIATAAICLCRICYCRYYVDHIATAAILRRYSLHKYSLRKHTIHTHITHPLLCLPPSSHHILNPDPIFPPSHKENT